MGAVQRVGVQGENVLSVFYLLEAPRTVQLLQCGERAAGDLLCSFNDPLKSCPLAHCAAAVPHACTVSLGALNAAPIKGHQQSLGDVVFPQNPQEVQSLLGLFQQLPAPRQVLLTMEAEVHRPFHTV